MKRFLVACFVVGCAVGGLAGCAEETPVTKKQPEKDEFQGFGALRVSEPKEKKAAAEPKKEEKPEEGGGDKGGGGGGGGGGEEAAALTKEQVLGALETAQKHINGCLKKFKDPAIYVVEITIAQDGSAKVEPIRAPTRKEQPDLWKEIEPGIDGGKNPKSPTNRCLATAISQVKFPAYKAEKPIVVTYPIVLR